MLAAGLVGSNALCAQEPVEMILQPPASHEPVMISAKAASRWREGAYEVWHLRGTASLRQGSTLATASEAVLWIEHSDAPSQQPTKIIAYFEPDALLRTGIGSQSNSSGAKLHEATWFGRFFTHAPLQIRTPEPGGKPAQLPPVYHRAQQRFEPRRDDAVAPAQFAEPVPARESLEPSPPGLRRIRAFPRSDARVQAQWFPSANGREWVAVIDAGVNLIIDGVEELGVLDIATDRMVIWGAGGQPDFSAARKRSRKARRWKSTWKGILSSAKAIASSTPIGCTTTLIAAWALSSTPNCSHRRPITKGCSA